MIFSHVFAMRTMWLFVCFSVEIVRDEIQMTPDKNLQTARILALDCF